MTTLKYKSCTDYWLDTSKMRLRGDFEQMYHDIADPWQCEADAQSLESRIFCELLFDGRRFERILDIGSALGGFTNCLFERNQGGSVIGCDVAPTAVQKAALAYPNIQFLTKNVLHDPLVAEGPFDLIVLSEVIWYLLDDLEGVFTKLSAVAPHGIVGVRQYFPRLQNYGRDIIDGLGGFERFLADRTSFVTERKVVSHHEPDGVVLLSTLRNP